MSVAARFLLMSSFLLACTAQAGSVSPEDFQIVEVYNQYFFAIRSAEHCDKRPSGNAGEQQKLEKNSMRVRGEQSRIVICRQKRHFYGETPNRHNMNDMIIGQNGASGVPAAELIKDTDTKNFMADVIEVSKKVPVLVDFWAPWCGPCKQLTPLLEKVVKQANGKVRLVKINVDENQQIAAQMRVQSIPAVFAFVNGQPIDGFMGALPEGQIRQFIDKLSSKGSLAEEIAAAMKVAEEAMQRKAFDEAQNILGQILNVDPTHIAALANFAKCQIELGDLEGAAATLAQVPPDKANNPDVVSAAAALDLALHPVDTSLLDQLQKAVAATPDDFAKRLELAVALNGAGQRPEATDQLLYVIRKKRDWNEDAARKQLVQFFEAWGPKDEATLQGRRKLSATLFS